MCFLTSQYGHLPGISATQNYYSKSEFHFLCEQEHLLCVLEIFDKVWLDHRGFFFQFSASSCKCPSLSNPFFNPWELRFYLFTKINFIIGSFQLWKFAKFFVKMSNISTEFLQSNVLPWFFTFLFLGPKITSEVTTGIWFFS